ncbi:unnamed protein product [Calypogeia fissa]
MSSNSDLVKWIAGAAALVCAGLFFLRKGLQTGGSSTMGGTSSLHRSLKEDRDKINDAVWELYSPSGPPAVEIIFFHGLQLDDFGDAFWSTWLASDGSNVIWPKEWLPEKFNDPARVLSVSYNSSARQITGQHDMYLLGENLVADIISDPRNIGQNCPVFLVGHCLGGIVLKQFILFAQKTKNEIDSKTNKREFDRIDKFLANIRGAFYYGTPHAGSKQIQNLAERLPKKGHMIELMKLLATGTARINAEFSKQRGILNVRTYAIAENLPTTTNGFNGLVAEEGSERQDLDGMYTHTADHFTVCKARNRHDSTVIGKLTQFITDNSSVQLNTQQARLVVELQ